MATNSGEGASAAAASGAAVSTLLVGTLDDKEEPRPFDNMQNEGDATVTNIDVGRPIHTAATRADTQYSEAMPPKPVPHIPTNEEEFDHVHEIYGSGSKRAMILMFLHSKKVQYTLMGLLLLDVVILFVELFLGAQYPMCYTIVRDAISCCPAAGAVAEGSDEAHRSLGGETSAGEATCEAHSSEASASVDGHRILRFLEASGEEEHHAACEAGVDTPQCPAGCDEHKYEAIHKTEEVLFYFTISILSIFMIELILLIFCLGPRVFFRKFFYALDFVVVSSSLALEITFHLLHSDTLQSLVGLIIIARLWRFVRIGHGLVEVTHEYAARKHDKLMKYTHELEDLLKENNIDLPPRKNIEKIKRLDSVSSGGES